MKARMGARWRRAWGSSGWTSVMPKRMTLPVRAVGEDVAVEDEDGGVEQAADGGEE